MKLLLAWKAIMTYWLPERALTGKQTVSLVKSFLIGFVTTKACLERGASKDGLGFVDRTF